MNTSNKKRISFNNEKITAVIFLATLLVLLAGTLISGDIAAKSVFINIHGVFQNVLGKSVVNDSKSQYDVYKMTNGQLTYAYPKYDTDPIVEQFKLLKDACDKEDIPLLYIQWPYKVDKYNNQLPHGMEDYGNLNADSLLEGLELAGIDTLDYREVVRDLDAEYSSLFFNTDHHWTTDTAFDAYIYLLSYLKENYGLDYDEMLVDKSNYTRVEMPASFIGSQANRTGRLYAGIDDFSYIYPNFDTDFRRRRYNSDREIILKKNGSFEKALLVSSIISNPETAMTYRDSCYFGAHAPLTRVRNNKVDDGSILIVGDSFCKPVSAFLSLSVDSLRYMYLEDYNSSSLIDFIQGKDIDVLIVAYNPSAIKKESASDLFVFDK